MPSYKAPVDDTLFLLRDVLDYGRYGNLPRFGEAPLDVVEAVLSEGGKFAEEVLQPLNRTGDLQGCVRDGRRLGHDAEGLQGGLQGLFRGRLGRARRRPRLRRPGPAAFPRRRAERIRHRRQSGLRHVSGPDQRRGGGAGDARQRRAEAALPAEDDDRRVDRHDEPDRAALRHRSRSDQDARDPPAPTALIAITGQKIFISAGEHDLADNIIHLVLARIDGAPAGTKGISLFVVPKFLVGDDGVARRAQRRLLRLDRAQDGHPRQFDLRDQLRRRQGLAGRRGEPRPQRDVRDDERGAARRRGAGPEPVRGRLSERRRLRQGAPAGPLADRPQGARQAGRPDHRPSRRAAHAARDPRLQRGGARADAVGRALRGRSAVVARRQGAPGSPTTASAC